MIHKWILSVIALVARIFFFVALFLCVKVTSSGQKKETYSPYSALFDGNKASLESNRRNYMIYEKYYDYLMTNNNCWIIHTATTAPCFLGPSQCHQPQLRGHLNDRTHFEKAERKVNSFSGGRDTFDQCVRVFRHTMSPLGIVLLQVRIAITFKVWGHGWQDYR